jgi:WD repeat-containing protein 89
MSLVQAKNLQISSAPLKSINVSSRAYILFLTSIQDYYAAAQSAPSNVIDLIDKNTFQHVQSLPGHAVGTTYLRTVDNIIGFSRQCLVSSGKDGTLKVWDARSNSASIYGKQYT